MDNRDMPAMPVEELKCKGLSKREYIATMAMQGMLSFDSSGGIQPQVIAQSSVMFADALLKQLEDK